MTGVDRTFLLDSDVLISAYRDYFAPDYCPGFWDCLLHFLSIGRILIIDPVRAEVNHPDALVQWIDQLPSRAFAPIDSDVVETYGQMFSWVQANPQFNAAAENKFAIAADGWLAAFGGENDAIVITKEKSSPTSESTVKLPDLCAQFQVGCDDTQYMLRALGVRFEWSGP